MPTMTSHLPWTVLSGLGSANLTVALALVLVVFLVRSGDYRMARWWCALFLMAMCLVGATKLAFVGWGIAMASVDFTGASGHAARAAAVYPVVFFLLAKNHGAGMQRLALCAALFLAAAVGCSRIARQVHSLSEVAAGMGIGIMTAAACVRLAGNGVRARTNQLAPWLGIAALCAAGLPAAPTQAWLVHTGMALSGRPAPFTRHDLPVKPRLGRHQTTDDQAGGSSPPIGSPV